MAYTVMHNNPLIDANLINPDVIVHYVPEQDRFYVTFVETNCGYYVDRGELVSEEFKFTDTIEAKILEGCETDDDINIIKTSRADNEIYMIWMANCDIFN